MSRLIRPLAYALLWLPLAAAVSNPPTVLAADSLAADVAITAPVAQVGDGKEITRTVTATRILTPFGASPGEVVAAQKPMEVTDTGGTSWSSGGFKRTLWDRLASWVGNLWWLLLLVSVGSLVLYAIPVTRPLVTAAGRFVLWLVPAVGGAIEAAVQGKAAASANTNFSAVVAGGDRFMALVKESDGFSAEQKAAIIALFKQAQAAAQDKATQQAVAVERSQ